VKVGILHFVNQESPDGVKVGILHFVKNLTQSHISHSHFAANWTYSLGKLLLCIKLLLFQF